MPEPTEGVGQTQETPGTEAPGSATPPNFEAWLEGQTDEVKGLLDGHTKGLKSALESERGTRKDLEKQMRDLAGKAEKGSEAEAALTKAADAAQEADRRADFFLAAHTAGIVEVKLAYTVAVQDEMFDKRGQVNFETLKQQYPALFGGKPGTPPGNAGAGTGSAPPATASGMNEAIRRAAGR